MLEALWEELKYADEADDIELLILHSFEIQDDYNLRVHLEIRYFREPPHSSHWNLTAIDVRGYSFISAGPLELPELHSNHPLLLPFVDQQTVLYYRGGPDDSLPLLGALYTAHRNIVGEWIPLSAYVRLEALQGDTWKVRYGQLAKGPITLLNSYAVALERFGVQCSLLPSTPPPGIYRNYQWIDDKQPLHALVLGPSNWIVATSFVIAKR